MEVKNAEIRSALNTMAEKYRIIAQSLSRYFFPSLGIDDKTWSHLEKIVSRDMDGSFPSLHYDELYQSILAVAIFISKIRKVLIPNINTIKNQAESRSWPAQERVYRDLALSNLEPNITVLSQQLRYLYGRLREQEMKLGPRFTARVRSVPEADRIEQLLER